MGRGRVEIYGGRDLNHKSVQVNQSVSYCTAGGSVGFLREILRQQDRLLPEIKGDSAAEFGNCPARRTFLQIRVDFHRLDHILQKQRGYRQVDVPDRRAYP